MEEIVINNESSLSKVEGLIHDSAFKIAEIEYNKADGLVKVVATLYKFKGKFIPAMTDVVDKQYRLFFYGVKSLEIEEKDRKGYHVLGQDFINTIKIEKEKNIIIGAAFHRIIITRF
jgi:predicted ribonuclease toxin of YeeF-YezG toxin-antitoxin module